MTAYEGPAGPDLEALEALVKSMSREEAAGVVRCVIGSIAEGIDRGHGVCATVAAVVLIEPLVGLMVREIEVSHEACPAFLATVQRIIDAGRAAR